MRPAIEEEIVHRTTVRLTPKGLARLTSRRRDTRLTTRRIIEHALLLYVTQLTRRERQAVSARREGGNK